MMNTPEQSLRSQLKNFYQQSECYLAMINPETNPHRIEINEAYVDFIHKYVDKGKAVLDLGCGTGFSSFLLAKRGFKVTGLDISDKFLKIMKPKESKDLKFVAGDILNLEFPDCSFDLVTSHEVIEHITNVEKALSEMARVVKRGGRIIIVSPNLGSPLNPLRFIMSKKKTSSLYKNKSQALFEFFRRCGWLIVKRIKSLPEFSYCQPDLSAQFDSDSDTVYIASYLDIAKYLKRQGFKISHSYYQSQRLGGKILSLFFPSLSSGIRIVAEKVQ